MAKHATPPEVLDEKFIQILMEELMPATSSFPREGVGEPGDTEPKEAVVWSAASASERSCADAPDDGDKREIISAGGVRNPSKIDPPARCAPGQSRNVGVDASPRAMYHL